MSANREGIDGLAWTPCNITCVHAMQVAPIDFSPCWLQRMLSLLPCVLGAGRPVLVLAAWVVRCGG